jgi:hypothetical protein
MFDFDRVIERRGTHSSKWDNIIRLSGIESPDAIPMWVADMDFAAPPGVTSALTAEIQRAVHGYYADTGSWAAALADWMARRHGLRIDPSWVSPTPGIVSGLGLILQAVSTPGDEVVVFPPAYHAFRRIIVANERRILDAQLVETDGRYTMDLDALSVGDRGAFIWPSDYDSRVCWGAFAAIQELSQIYEDGKPILPGICARPSTTRIQYIRIFLRYLGEHPELADAEFAWVAGKALSEAFPCP